MEMLKKKVNELTNRQILFNPKTKRKKRVKKVQIQKRTALQQIVLGQLSTQYAKKKNTLTIPQSLHKN